MKTKIRECFGLLVFVLTMLSLTSCEVEIDSWYDNDDYSEVYYRKTHELCSRTWQESWEQDGKYYTQRLDFYENRTGKDYIRVEYRDGCVTEDICYFDWNWDNNTQTCIRMKYGPDDVSYFERIWMSDNTLSGLLDGTEVYFKGRY